MGLRATVIKTYKVEYGNANGFNYDVDTLNNIIGEFCDDFYNGDDGWGGPSTDAIWEIDKQQFREMYTQIALMPEEEFNERMKEEWFCGTFSDDKPYSKAYIMDVFAGYINETPEDSNYVRIGWL